MIGADGLGMRFDRRILFRNLTFRVEPGQRLVITGANGSGKSTLLRILAGLMRPTDGTVVRPAEPIRSLGYVALDGQVYPGLTVREHLEFAGAMREVTPRCEELLQKVGLLDAANRLGRQLSTGMRSRLKIALALQSDPAILMWDEPGAALDEQGRALLESILAESHHRAVLIATNDPDERRWATHELHLG